LRTTAEPSAKTGYTILGGAVVTIIAWILATVAGIEIPAEVSAAATTIVTAAIALLVPAKSGKYVYTGPISPDPDPGDAIEFYEDDPTPSEFAVDAEGRVTA
jgi:hypothetical protein